MLRLKQLAPPIPKSSASDRQEVENGKAMFVAAFSELTYGLPRIKSWSTMLYSAPTSIAIMLGTGKFDHQGSYRGVP